MSSRDVLQSSLSPSQAINTDAEIMIQDIRFKCLYEEKKIDQELTLAAGLS